jgi:ClpP class serine protease
MTITGSIGIFSGSFDISEMLARIGLSWTTMNRGAHADLLAPYRYRPLSEADEKFIKQKLHYLYVALSVPLPRAAP